MPVPAPNPARLHALSLLLSCPLLLPARFASVFPCSPPPFPLLFPHSPRLQFSGSEYSDLLLRGVPSFLEDAKAELAKAEAHAAEDVARRARAGTAFSPRAVVAAIAAGEADGAAAGSGGRRASASAAAGGAGVAASGGVEAPAAASAAHGATDASAHTSALASASAVTLVSTADVASTGGGAGDGRPAAASSEPTGRRRDSGGSTTAADG